VFDVRLSKLGPNSGLVLVAYKTFPKGSKVASYSGNIVPTAKAKDSQYAVSWTGKVVDSNSTQNSVGRYANTWGSAEGTTLTWLEILDENTSVCNKKD
jgi:hypothetical protein